MNALSIQHEDPKLRLPIVIDRNGSEFEESSTSSEEAVRIKVPTAKKGRKDYNPSWLKDPRLKRWVKAPEDGNDRITCPFCDSFIRCHKADLIGHTHTLRHQRAYKLKCTEEEYEIFIQELDADPKRKTKVASTFDWSTMIITPKKKYDRKIKKISGQSTNVSLISNLPQPSLSLPMPNPPKVEEPNLQNQMLSAANENNNENDLTQDNNFSAPLLDARGVSNMDDFPFSQQQLVSPLLVNGYSANIGSPMISTFSTAQFPISTSTVSSTQSPSRLVDMADLFQGGEEFIVNVPPADSPRGLVAVVLDDQHSPMTSSYSSSDLLSSSATTVSYIDKFDEEFSHLVSSGTRLHSSVEQLPTQYHQLQPALFDDETDQQMLSIFDNPMFPSLAVTQQEQQQLPPPPPSLQSTQPESVSLSTATTTTSDTSGSFNINLNNNNNSISTICTPSEFINAVQNNYFTLDEVCSVAVACVSHVKNMINALNIQTINLDQLSPIITENTSTVTPTTRFSPVITSGAHPTFNFEFLSVSAPATATAAATSTPTNVVETYTLSSNSVQNAEVPYKTQNRKGSTRGRGGSNSRKRKLSDSSSVQR